MTSDVILVFTVTTGMGRAKGEGAGVGSGQKVLGMPGAASGTARRWRDAAQAVHGSMIQHWELRSLRDSWGLQNQPYKGWWAQQPPSSNPKGFRSRPGIPALGSGAWPWCCPSVPGAFRRSQSRD